MLRAVPATMLMAASTDAALRSGIFCSAIFLTCSCVICATFVLFGTPEPLSISAGLFNQHRSRRSLRYEREGTVGINRDDDRDNNTDIVLRSFVEFLCESHNVDAMLTKSRSYRRRRRCFAGRYLELNKARYLLSHLLHLQNLW